MSKRGERTIRNLKRLARRGLRRLHLERVWNPNFVDLMRELRTETVLDVGANVGQYAQFLRQLDYRGRIVSFEPIRSVYEQLEREARSDPLWEVHNFAFGDVAGERDILVSESTDFSSFKKGSSYLADMFEASASVRRETVTIERLDSFLSRSPSLAESAYLKVDTQGFEREVLEGAGTRLADLQAVQLELPMRSLYEGQDSWVDMVQWLAAQDYEIAMAKENNYHPRRIRLLELDVVFVKASG